ncbi:hypothetical protein TCAL_03811 [Tigriopus californicus]|uniref:Platelet-derived growth factor (PDGF) family profile domain-containing protein n=2 Tax=Tigriopus californicus TaxID=6832 RepID=A0A553NUD5_TIGCA|nr:hypothetical protein TCAL_03811 [Tigriopus californicus]|eukprot:TCALIF_03811-PA protein Name:"Protein of unknown function" AED:0.25 eAED:0.25 QI:0/-1/0/1/-1/1/1/0/304
MCTTEQQRRILPTMLGCAIRDEIIELDLPNATYLHVYPRHVTVRRCGGSCQGSHHSCLPLTTESRNVDVHLFPSSGISGATPSECAKAEIIDHASCGCSCKTSAEDCTPGLQVFTPNECRCVCVNERARSDCLNRGWYWNSPLCQCMCQNPMSFPRCPSGYHYDGMNTCSCVNYSEYASPILEVLVLILISAVGITTLSLAQCYKHGIGIFHSTNTNNIRISHSRERNATELRTLFRALSSSSQRGHISWLGYSQINETPSPSLTTNNSNSDLVSSSHPETTIIRNQKKVANLEPLPEEKENHY